MKEWGKYLGYKLKFMIIHKDKIYRQRNFSGV